MIDKDFAIQKIKLRLTDQCPSNCLGCSKGNGKEFDFNALKNVLSFAAAKNAKIALSGGEPLMYKNWVVLTKELGKLKLKGSLTTSGQVNGTETMVSSLPKGFSVKISIHGSDKNTHELFSREIGSFNKTLKSLYLIARNQKGRQLYAQSVVWQNNMNSLIGLPKLLNSIGIYDLQLLPYNGASLFNSISLEKSKDFAEKIIHQANIYSLKLLNIDLFKNFNFHKNNADKTVECLAPSSRLAICPTGDVFPCIRLTRNPAAKMFNILDGKTNTDLEHISYSSTRVRAKKMLFKECIDCIQKTIYFGNC